MRILYLGSGEFGLPTLSALADSHTILAVVSQPDRPAGRGRELTPTPIAAWAASHLPDVPLLKPENVNDPDVAARLRALDADAWVVIAFGQKLGRALLADRFAINLHASLLPRWRGAAPINAAILAGDTHTGNTVITLADRMDAGEILAQSRRAIDPASTAGVLHDLLAADGPAIVQHVLAARAAGSLHPRPQDESLATRAPKLSRADAWVDFSRPAPVCRCRIHALTPWPGVTVRLIPAPANDRTPESQELKVTLVESTSGDTPGSPTDAPPGTLLDIPLGLVACGQGTALRVLMVKPPGKREMAWRDFLQGHRVREGARLEGKPTP